MGVGAALLSCATLIGAGPLKSVDGTDAAQWLARMRSAAGDRDYFGTMTTSAGAVVSVSHVAHVCRGRDRFELIESLEGQPRKQYRHNGLVLTKWPQSKVAVSEKRDAVTDFPALPEASPSALESYELKVLGREPVAGHEAEVLLLRPRDDLRYGQRLWAERQSGLLLRSEVLNAKGEVLESSIFTELKFGVKKTAATLRSDMGKLEGYRVARPESRRAYLEDEGWQMQGKVPGFQLISCVKRALDATAEGPSPELALQAVFSDGLTHVSMFIERYDARRHKPMRTVLGATNTLMNRQGDWWVTIVGDVPMATVQRFETMLHRRP